MTASSPHDRVIVIQPEYPVACRIPLVARAEAPRTRRNGPAGDDLQQFARAGEREGEMSAGGEEREAAVPVTKRREHAVARLGGRRHHLGGQAEPAG